MTEWSDVRAAFDQLLLLPEAERRERLAEIASRDSELARELRSLLLHDGAVERDGEFLAGGDSTPESPNLRAGPYELLRELGRGGMGVVHLARRADGAFERRVAVKLIRSGVTDEHVLERFRRERQVLANLTHNGIARMIEGGATEDGTPYLVMEYVEGVPIDHYCDAERLPVAARLALFLQVCDAVQHAHENLVVHRDLKPRNILVTATGEPKLLDFGIAKMLDPEKTSAAPEVTVGLTRLLTPAYASPEQVAGRPVNTSSDVYSLGVVLFQLLTGELPYAVETTSAAEIERIVCGIEPSRPSACSRALAEDVIEPRARARMTTPLGLTRALAGDLDRIVLKALRKEPRLRYGSVDKFADDLRRYLSGRPVTAQADTFLYRASKFLNRNRAAVTAGTLVLLALTCGLAFSLSQNKKVHAAEREERQQRELAEERLGESERLARDLEGERTAAQVQLAEVERLNTEIEAQRAVAQRRFEELQGFSQKLIFDIYGELVRVQGTLELQEFVIEAGVASLDRLAADAEGDLNLQRDLAHAYIRVATVQSGGVSDVANIGSFDDALENADKAVSLATSLVAAEPDPGNAYTLGFALLTKGSVLQSKGHEDRGLEAFQAALEATHHLEHDPDSNAGQLYLVFVCKSKLAEIQRRRLPGSEVLKILGECEVLLERVVKKWNTPTSNSDLESIRGSMAEIEYSQGGGDAAIGRLEEALKSLERIAAKATHDPDVARKTRRARAVLASILSDTGPIERAEELLATNRKQLEAAIAKEPANMLQRQDLVANTCDRMALHSCAEDWASVLRVGEAGLALARENAMGAPNSAEESLLLAQLLCHLGTSQRHLDLPLEAGQSLKEAGDILEKLAARDSSFLGASCQLPRVYAELGRAHSQAAQRAGEDAELARRSLSIAAEWFGRAVERTERLGEPAIAEARLDLDEMRAELSESRAALAAIDDETGK